MPSDFRDILLKLCRREDLTRDESRDAFLHLMSGDATDAQVGGLLVGLAAKGTTVDELVGAATGHAREGRPRRLRRPATSCSTPAAQGATSGGTFNISTAAALVAAAGGVKVVKHGNRSASGSAGSADVLEKLGRACWTLAPKPSAGAWTRPTSASPSPAAHHPAMRFVAAAPRSRWESPRSSTSSAR